MAALLKLSTLIDSVNEWIGKLTMWLVLAAVVISAGNATLRVAPRALPSCAKSASESHPAPGLALAQTSRSPSARATSSKAEGELSSSLLTRREVPPLSAALAEAIGAALFVEALLHPTLASSSKLKTFEKRPNMSVG